MFRPQLPGEAKGGREESVAASKGFEPLTPRVEVWCSIQLSYEAIALAGIVVGTRLRPSSN